MWLPKHEKDKSAIGGKRMAPHWQNDSTNKHGSQRPPRSFPRVVIKKGFVVF
jgi:hypothetical protein